VSPARAGRRITLGEASRQTVPHPSYLHDRPEREPFKESGDRRKEMVGSRVPDFSSPMSSGHNLRQWLCERKSSQRKADHAGAPVPSPVPQVPLIPYAREGRPGEVQMELFLARQGSAKLTQKTVKLGNGTEILIHKEPHI
jgi:hypothetical protein